MTWDEYSDLMAENGQKVYATQIGHHGIYEGVVHQSPTVYPIRLDTHEMRLNRVMREVYPLIAWAKQGGHRCRILWPQMHSEMFRTLIGDVSRRLVDEGYTVSEKISHEKIWCRREACLQISW